MDCFPVINHSIAWAMGRGILINVGMDLVIGLKEKFILSRKLISHLHSRNYVVLQHVWKLDRDGFFNWLSTEDLQIFGMLRNE